VRATSGTEADAGGGGGAGGGGSGGAGSRTKKDRAIDWLCLMLPEQVGDALLATLSAL
jgi:hypothetical protein